MTNAGLGPIVASLTCDYRRQLRFPDEVSVGSRVGKLGNTSVELEHVVVSRMQGLVVATALKLLPSLRDNPQGRLACAAVALLTVLMVAFPDIALWLPNAIR